MTTSVKPELDFSLLPTGPPPTQTQKPKMTSWDRKVEKENRGQLAGRQMLSFEVHFEAGLLDGTGRPCSKKLIPRMCHALFHPPSLM